MVDLCEALEGPVATDFFDDLVKSIAAPIDAWLTEHGAADGAVLAPPTRQGSGDLAMACHRYARVFRKAPQMIATDVAAVAAAHPLVTAVTPVAGFLNLELDWPAVAEKAIAWALEDDGAIGHSSALAGRKVMVEYSSPNTNKPQHLGHCRNNILGHTIATLMEAARCDVKRVNLINDRGIAICKSMIAYQRFGEGVTPESSGKKGDHLVGEFYVKFDQAFKAEYAAATEGVEPRPDKDVYFNTQSELGGAARKMLLDWEAGDAEVLALWRLMNGWCEAGFQATYDRMGVRFDTIYKESQTYLLGKNLVTEGLESGVFHRAENGAAVFDLAKIGLEGEKAVARADGTSLYVTQDLGTAVKRHEAWPFDEMVYVVGNEQDHHFRVLFGILGELKPALKGRLHHLSYGMVELPDGKMKSREGTVVDADDLMDELHAAAAEKVRESFPELDAAAVAERAESIALGGLKFFLMKFAPATTFVFDKARSIQPQGETGPGCQYAYARASSILRKLDAAGVATDAPDWSLFEEPIAKALLMAILKFPGDVKTAAVERKPSLVCKSTYEVSSAFNGFFNAPKDAGYRVLDATGPRQAALVVLVKAARRVIGGGLELLGMDALEQM